MTGLQGLYSLSMNSTPKSSQASPTVSVDECNVQGVVGKSGERGSLNFYVSCSQEFAVLLLTP